MRTRCCVVALMILLCGLNFSEGQFPISLAITSSVDVTSGGIVCPNTRVEFTCNGVEIGSLAWQRNGMDIISFSLFSTPGSILQSPFTPYLDSISPTADGRNANMTSRLVFYLNNVSTSDQITCLASPTIRINQILDYMRRSAPNLLLQTEFTIILTTVSLYITWSSTFNSLHDVTYYRAVISGSSVAKCPSTCLPSEPCLCSRPMAGENVSINISAINCEDQEGPPISLIASPVVPSQPTRCSSLPVYNYKGDFIAFDFLWTRVEDPPEFSSGVRQEVTQYLLTVDGISTQTVSASTACPTVNCSHLVMLSNPPNAMLRGSVAAENVFGPGQSCTQQLQIDSRNEILTLVISTTDSTNRTVECTPMSQGLRTFECEFCYSPGISCQRFSSDSCVTINESVVLPPLNEVTYCYRATARVNGSSVAVVQGSFSTACQPQALETVNNTDANFSSSGSLSVTGGLVSYNGVSEGSVATYQCDKGYVLSGNIQRVCRSDGNWNGSVPMCIFERLTAENLGYLVCSLLLWIMTVILIVFETIYILFSLFKKCAQSTIFSIFFPRWTKIISIILLILAIVLTVTVVILWIVFGVAVGKPNKVSQRDSAIIAAFTVSLLAFILVITIPVIIYVVHTFLPPNKVTPSPHIVHSEKGSTKKAKSTTKEISEYAEPNQQKVSDGVDDHREGPNNRPKRKGFNVKRKTKEKNTFEMQVQQAEYNVLAGPGRLNEPHLANKATPSSPPKPGQYGTLNMEEGEEKGLYSVPHEKAAVALRYETMSGHLQTVGKVESGGTEVHEYSVVSKDKKKSRRK